MAGNTLPKRYLHPIIILGIVFFGLFGGGHIGEAQTTTGVGSMVSLVALPQFPNPHSPVTISLEAYTINTAGAEIVWYVDGVELTGLRNERSIKITSGDLGEKQIVRASIIRQGAPVVSSELTLRPTDVDIILEANTYIPAFYKGRALPSESSQVRVIAVPNVGLDLPASSYTYEWQYNGNVLLGGPVRGKQSINILMPRYQDEYVTVTVMDSDGAPLAERSLVLTPIEPELHFYEDNPLRGLSRKAIADSLTLIGEETTVHGEPYFMDTTLTPNDATYEWRVDGELVENGSADPHKITLRRNSGGGEAEIGFHILTNQKIPQYVENVFRIFFE